MKIFIVVYLLALNFLLASALKDNFANNGKERTNEDRQNDRGMKNDGDVQTALKKLMKSVKILSEKIDNMESNMGSMDKKIITISEDIVDLKKRKEKFTDLEKTVSTQSKELIKIQREIVSLHHHTSTTAQPTTHPTTFPVTTPTKSTKLKPTWRPTTGIIYYPQGTKEHSAPKCIETNPRLCFVGYGFPKAFRRYCGIISVVTFDKCVDYCVDNLGGGGCNVNGLMYDWHKGGECKCMGDSWGHYNAPGFIHYRFGTFNNI